MDRARFPNAHELSVPASDRPAVLLLVEEDLYAVTLERALARRGWRTMRTRGTTEALRLWPSSGARAALIDLDADGLAALTLLSALQATPPPCRAVVVTRDQTVQRLSEKVKRRLGISAIVIRPCHVDDVANALAAAASAAGAPAGASAAFERLGTR
jgi:two-component system response regulator RegA